jgi:hypothetical protein
MGFWTTPIVTKDHGFRPCSFCLWDSSDLFPSSDSECSYGLTRASDGRIYPRNPQAKTDAQGRFVLEFSKEDLEGAARFCVGQLVKRSGSVEVEVALFTSNGATWVQDLASLENERELDLTETPLQLVSDRHSSWGLKPD